MGSDLVKGMGRTWGECPVRFPGIKVFVKLVDGKQIGETTKNSDAPQGDAPNLSQTYFRKKQL